MSEPLRVAGIVNDSITDGPGMRLTVFVQGCIHHCDGCHNPQTHPFDGGYDMEISEIFDMVKKNPMLSGVTFSGGEPFCQPGALLPLAKMLKESGYELAIYTGFLFEELFEDKESDRFKLLSLADTLIDGPFIKAQRSLSLRFRGSDNQRIIDVPASLKAGRAVTDDGPRWNNI